MGSRGAQMRGRRAVRASPRENAKWAGQAMSGPKNNPCILANCQGLRKQNDGLAGRRAPTCRHEGASRPASFGNVCRGIEAGRGGRATRHSYKGLHSQIRRIYHLTKSRESTWNSGPHRPTRCCDIARHMRRRSVPSSSQRKCGRYPGTRPYNDHAAPDRHNPGGFPLLSRTPALRRCERHWAARSRRCGTLARHWPFVST